MNHKSSCHCYPMMVTVLLGFLVTNLHLCHAAGAPATNTARATEKSAAIKPAELSVAPSSHQEFSPTRPSWVDASPSLDGDVHRLPVTSMPCSTEALCEEALNANMRGAVENYIESLTGAEESSSVITLDDDWIQAHRDSSKSYRGTVLKGEETWYESATELVFDAEDQGLIHRLWRRNQMTQRLAALGIFSGVTVTFLIGIAASLSIVTRRAEQRVVVG